MDLLIASLGAAFLLGILDYFYWIGPYRALVALIASVGLVQALGVTPLPTLAATALASAFVCVAVLRVLDRMDRPTAYVGRSR